MLSRMQLFKICNYVIFRWFVMPYTPILSHLIYYVSNPQHKDLSSLKISRRYNDHLIYKARMTHYDYLNSLPNSMERKYICKEIDIMRNRIRKMYKCYKQMLETDPVVKFETRKYLKKVTDDFYDVLIMFYSID